MGQNQIGKRTEDENDIEDHISFLNSTGLWSFCSRLTLETHDVWNEETDEQLVEQLTIPENLMEKLEANGSRKKFFSGIIEVFLKSSSWAIVRLFRAILRYLNSSRVVIHESLLRSNEEDNLTDKLNKVLNVCNLLHLITRALTETLSIHELLYYMEYVIEYPIEAENQVEPVSETVMCLTYKHKYIINLIKNQFYEKSEKEILYSIERELQHLLAEAGVSVNLSEQPFSGRTFVFMDTSTKKTYICENLVNLMQNHEISHEIAVIPLYLFFPYYPTKLYSTSLTFSIFLKVILFLTQTSKALLGSHVFVVSRIHMLLLACLLRFLTFSDFNEYEGGLASSTSLQMHSFQYQRVFIEVLKINLYNEKGNENSLSSCSMGFSDTTKKFDLYVASCFLRYLFSNLWIDTEYIRKSIQHSPSPLVFDALLMLQLKKKKKVNNLNKPSKLVSLSVVLINLIVIRSAFPAIEVSTESVLPETIIIDAFAAIRDYTNFTPYKKQFVLEGISLEEGVSDIIPLSFDAILAAFCSVSFFLEYPSAALLLYNLVYRNRYFRLFMETRSEAQYFVLPILRRIYETVEVAKVNLEPLPKNDENLTRHLPMIAFPPRSTCLLLVLLVLCNNPNFQSNFFTLELSGLPDWFEASPQVKLQYETKPQIFRSYSRFTLGSFVLLMVIKLILWNSSTFNDLVAYEICGGLIVNLCSRASNMHWLVAEKFVKMGNKSIEWCLEVLSKLYVSNDSSKDSSKTVKRLTSEIHEMQVLSSVTLCLSFVIALCIGLGEKKVVNQQVSCSRSGDGIKISEIWPNIALLHAFLREKETFRVKLNELSKECKRILGYFKVPVIIDQFENNNVRLWLPLPNTCTNQKTGFRVNEHTYPIEIIEKLVKQQQSEESVVSSVLQCLRLIAFNAHYLSSQLNDFDALFYETTTENVDVYENIDFVTLLTEFVEEKRCLASAGVEKAEQKESGCVGAPTVLYCYTESAESKQYFECVFAQEVNILLNEILNFYTYF